MEIIARIYTDLPEKFGIPRQSGIVDGLCGKIVFEDKYRVKEALDGIEEFSHLWLIWQFSENIRADWSPTVRPPRLNGNTRKGVFATRSPFRPNPIGLSCVKLLSVEHDKNNGYTLIVGGVDMMSGTPIYDIKPYITYTDSRPDAIQGFAGDVMDYRLNVNFAENLLELLPAKKRKTAIELLEQDPRPAYHDDAIRIYGMKYAGFDIKFCVDGNELTVVDVTCDSE